MLRQVDVVKQGNSYCLTWRGYQDAIINYRMLWGYGDANRKVIESYNEKIEEAPSN